MLIKYEFNIYKYTNLRVDLIRINSAVLAMLPWSVKVNHPAYSIVIILANLIYNYSEFISVVTWIGKFHNPK